MKSIKYYFCHWTKIAKYLEIKKYYTVNPGLPYNIQEDGIM